MLRFFPAIIKALSISLLMLAMVLPVVLVIAGIQTKPMLNQGKSLTHGDVTRLTRLVRQHNKHSNQHKIRRLQVMERDVNLLLDYALSRHDDLNAQVWLRPGAIDVGAMLRLPQTPFGEFLNIRLLFSKTDNTLNLASFRIGALRFSGGWFNPLLLFIHEKMFDLSTDYRDIVGSVTHLGLYDKYVEVMYLWQRGLLSRLRTRGTELLLPQANKHRYQYYHNEMMRLEAENKRYRVPVNDILKTLFSLAKQQVELGQDPMAENRAVLLTLGMYVMGIDMSKFITKMEKSTQRKTQRMRLRLLGRRDLMQHFVISAMVTLLAGGGVADALGLFKELGDSRKGTGFSFADLLADRAGVKFAETATASAASARLLQTRMLLIENDEAFMPSYQQLPEGIMELEFKQRFHDLDSKAYQLVDGEIERRIATREVFRD